MELNHQRLSSSKIKKFCKVINGIMLQHTLDSSSPAQNENGNATFNATTL